MTAAYQGPHRNWCTKNIFMAFTDFSTKRGKMKRKSYNSTTTLEISMNYSDSSTRSRPSLYMKAPAGFS